jgi:hypothetical protein
MPNNNKAITKLRESHTSGIWTDGSTTRDTCHVMNKAQEKLEDIFSNLSGISHPGLQ